MSALPFIFRQRPLPYNFWSRARSRMACPRAMVSRTVISPMISPSIPHPAILSARSVSRRLDRPGPNRLAKRRKPTPWKGRTATVGLLASADMNGAAAKALRPTDARSSRGDPAAARRPVEGSGARRHPRRAEPPPQPDPRAPGGPPLAHRTRPAGPREREEAPGGRDARGRACRARHEGRPHPPGTPRTRMARADGPRRLHQRDGRPLGLPQRHRPEPSAEAEADQQQPTPRTQSAIAYDHWCPVCQSSRQARRPVKAWRCAACVAAGLDGRLEITRRARRPKTTP